MFILNIISNIFIFLNILEFNKYITNAIYFDFFLLNKILFLLYNYCNFVFN